MTALFICHATASDRRSFVPIWKLCYISDVVAEDRCHLNGLAMGEGRPKWVTVIAKTDVADAWRKRRRPADGNWISIRRCSTRHNDRGTHRPVPRPQDRYAGLSKGEAKPDVNAKRRDRRCDAGPKSNVRIRLRHRHPW